MVDLERARPQVTELLAAWNEGNKDAIDQLMPVVETELRRIAHNYMRREDPDHTLQTTALVNEAYLKLVDQRNVNWQNRAHFFALSATVMRRILLNHARDRLAAKRGAGAEHVDIDGDGTAVISAERSKELVALDDALEALAKVDKLKSRIVELRYFGGLTLEETAEVLGIAPITVSVHWRMAKAWLARELSRSN